MASSPITISDDENASDEYSEDNKVERFICQSRLTDLVGTIGPRFRESDRAQQLGLANGMRFEASFAASLSGSLAIRGLKIIRIPPQGPVEESIPALIQRFGFVSPDSGRHLMAAAHHAQQFTEEHLDYNYTGPRGCWTRHSEALLCWVFGPQFRLEDTYWWRSQSSDIITGSNIAKAGLAAHLYMTYEPFRSQSSGPVTAEASLDVIFAIETLLGEIKRLRVQLLEHHRQLIMMSVDREIQLAATYSAAYDGVAESASDAVDEIVGGLGVVGDREQVRALMRQWAGRA